MLRHTLFEIKSLDISPDKDIAQANISLNADHPIFKGHFPDNPVLPGVCIIQIIKETVSAIANKDLMLSKSNTIKFQSPINPLLNNELIIDLKTKFNVDIIEVNAQVSFQDIKFCTFKGEFVTL